MASGPEANSRHHDTIIIGAGISGLACAQKLLQHPSYNEEKKLLVLEARDRIGGRIGSVRVNGNRLDTGANWIHGIGSKDDPNPLVDILPHKEFRELGRSVNFRPFETSDAASSTVVESQADNDWVKIDSDKTESHTQQQRTDLVVPSNIAVKLTGSLWALIGSLHERAAESSAEEAKDTTILKAIAKSETFQEAFKMLPEEYHPALRAMPQFVESMEAAPLAAQSAEHDADHPGMGLLEYALDDFDGEQVFLRDGYTAVVEEVGQKALKHGQIKLGVEVQQISWDKDHIRIVTSDGSYTARKVICTLPLGVLQHHVKQSPKLRPAPFFTPPLPAEKTEAITSLGFGTLDKIFLVYSKPWWTEEPYTSILKKGLVHRPFPDDPNKPPSDLDECSEPDAFSGFTNELPGIAISPDGTSQPGIRSLSVINLHALTGFPVLSSFVSCANAVHVEGLSDHAASMIVHRALTKWLGREPPRPEAVHVTRWATDEFSRGSYSHMITGLSETRHRQIFQKPLVGAGGAKLRFAGEHTSLNHFATAHGALISGWREAEEILRDEGEKGV